MRSLTLLFLALPLSVFAQRGENQLEFQNKSRSLNSPAPSSYSNVERDQFYGNSQLATGYITEQPGSPHLRPTDKNHVYLSSTGLYNATPESYLAVFNLTQVGSNAREADQLMMNKFQGLMDTLKSLGIKEADMQTDMIYLIPLYEFAEEKRMFSTSFTEIPSGFELQKNLHIRFTDPKLVDRIITFAAQNELYDLVSLEVSVSDTKAIYDQLRKKAVADIQAKTGDFKALGLDLTAEFMILGEQRSAIYPETRYQTFKGYAASQKSPTAKGSGTVTTIRKPVAVAYQKLPYDNFDVVINPHIVGPVIQFTYKLEVKYTLDKQMLEPINHYYLITPEGRMEKLIVK